MQMRGQLSDNIVFRTAILYRSVIAHRHSRLIHDELVHDELVHGELVHHDELGRTSFGNSGLLVVRGTYYYMTVCNWLLINQHKS